MGRIHSDGRKRLASVSQGRGTLVYDDARVCVIIYAYVYAYAYAYAYV